MKWTNESNLQHCLINSRVVLWNVCPSRQACHSSGSLYFPEMLSLPIEVSKAAERVRRWIKKSERLRGFTMASNEEEMKMLETRQVRDVRRLQGKYGCWGKTHRARRWWRETVDCETWILGKEVTGFSHSNIWWKICIFRSVNLSGPKIIMLWHRKYFWTLCVI